MIDKQKLAKAIKEGRITDKTTLAIFAQNEELKQEIETKIADIKSKVDEAVKQVKESEVSLPKVLEAVKGKDGEKGEKGEKGDRGEKGNDGKDGRNGKDGKNGVDGLPGKDAEPVDTVKIALDAQKGAYEELLPKMPTIEQIEADIPKLGNPIRDSLELLQKDDRLDASAIKGLEKMHADTLNRAVSILDQRTQFLINKVSNISSLAATVSEIDLSSQCNGVATDFTLGTTVKYIIIINLNGTIVPYTLNTAKNQITLTIAPASGEELKAITLI